MGDQRTGTRFLGLPGFVLVLSAVCFAPPTAIGAGVDGEGERQTETAGRKGAQDATAAIRQLIAKYAEAVNAEPVDVGLASQVWLNSPEVSLIFPLGEEHGWNEVKQNFYENTMEALFSERRLTPRNITVHAYGDSAWAEFSWRFVAKSRKNGSNVETSGRETQIYERIGPDRWALVHVHYSAMPPGGSLKRAGCTVGKWGPLPLTGNVYLLLAIEPSSKEATLSTG
jgi:ketosteroid isomerase-like protein